MITRLPLLSSAAIALILFWSCNKDDESISDKYLSTFTAKVENEITSSVTGYVYDENKKPVADAEVAIYSARTRTNRHGYFAFDNKKMDGKGTLIKVQKTGYLHTSDMVYPSSGIKSYSFIKLLSSASTGEFDSGTGGKISVTGGASINFEPSSVVDAKGNLYTGKVAVTAKYLNPNANDLGDVMPGALCGSRAGGEKVVLGTLGMVVAELHDTKGNLLNIGNGKKATIEIPAATQNLPPSIPLWWFDEDKGIWVEEGEATLQGQAYTGQVSHFSFWNCDLPLESVYGCLKFVDSRGNKLRGIEVTATAQNLACGFSITNSKGEIFSYFPKNKTITLSTVIYGCKQTIYTGQFSANFPEGVTVELNTLKNSVNVKVVCGKNPKPGSFVHFKSETYQFVADVDESGLTNIQLPASFCTTKKTFDITAHDIYSGNYSITRTIDLDTISNSDTLFLDICEVHCDFQAFFYVTKILGDSTHMTANLLLKGGSGNFKFKWSTGETTEKIKIKTGTKDLCVTIQDIDSGCEKYLCKSNNVIGGCDDQLETVCSVTTIGWCGNTGQFEILLKSLGNNTFDLIRTDKNEADFSMGAYGLCYGPSAIFPGGDLKLVITDCHKLSYTGKSRWGETYFIREVHVNGDEMYLSWKNDYDPEAGESILKRKDGLSWPELVK